MKQIANHLPDSLFAIAGREVRHQIEIRWNATPTIGNLLQDLAETHRVLVLADPIPWSHCRDRVLRSLREAGFSVEVIAFPAGERNKSMEAVRAAIEELVRHGAQRRDMLLMVGGGVVCDAGGLLASLFMRGVPYFLLPTTLLAQVDASIGGKVAVNHASAKNLIGAFHHPQGVLMDPSLLRTLPPEEMRNGFAEMVKVAMLDGHESLAMMASFAAALQEGAPLEQVWVQAIHRAVAIKLAFLEGDPYEKDLNRPLNLGHAVAHALETAHAYRGARHGYAVAVGLAVAVRISFARGLASREFTQEVHDILHAACLPTFADRLGPAEVWSHMEAVRRIRNGSLREVLPMDDGKCEIVDDLSWEEFRSAYLDALWSEANDFLPCTLD